MNKIKTIKSIFAQFLAAFFLIFQMQAPAFAQSQRDLTIIKQSKISNSSTGVMGVRNLKNETDVTTSGDTSSVVNPLQMNSKTSPFETVSNITVHVLGDVKFPGVYPAKVSDRAAEILKLSMPNRPNVRMIEIRHEGSKSKYYDLYRYNLFGDLDSNPYLNDGDVIYIPLQKAVVRVDGSVNRPGEYELKNEKNISEVLALAGGLTDGASKINTVKVIRFSEEGKKFILDVENQPNELKNFKIQKGDVILFSSIAVADKKFDYTIESMPGEKPFYPTSTPEVVVMGQVNNPGPYPFKPHLTIKDYVAYAGPDFDAKLGKVDVMRSGKKMRMSFGENLESGDLIIVKRKMQFKEYISFTSSSLALVLSVLVLENRLNK